jgi:nitrous oxidase accessory protein NosD
VILRLEITKLSYIENAIFWSSLNISLIKENKWENIRYNINYIKVFEWSSEDSSPYMN